MAVQPRELRNYLTADGTSPFEEWLNALRDRQAQIYWRDYEERENTNK